MAELSYNDYSQSSRVPLGATVSAVTNWAGAVLSLVLVAGLAYWGYQLLVRDVTGVPVVRALEGPMRIAPEDPGGDRAAYQGLAVNAIAAEGVAEEPAERVVLAPPEPEFTEEDLPMAALLPDTSEEPLPVVEARAVSATDLAVAAALAESPLLTLASASVEAVPVFGGAEVSPDAIPADTPGVAVSPRPVPRPEGLSEMRLASLEVDDAVLASAPGSAPGLDADPATIAEGERLVQLGAFPTEEFAREEWNRITTRFGEFMTGKQRVIQEAEAGGRVFYRLRVLGFEDLSDSRRFCAVLVAGDASCIPVSWR